MSVREPTRQQLRIESKERHALVEPRASREATRIGEKSHQPRRAQLLPGPGEQRTPVGKHPTTEQLERQTGRRAAGRGIALAVGRRLDLRPEVHLAITLVTTTAAQAGDGSLGILHGDALLERSHSMREKQAKRLEIAGLQSEVRCAAPSSRVRRQAPGAQFRFPQARELGRRPSILEPDAFRATIPRFVAAQAAGSLEQLTTALGVGLESLRTRA